uniref:Uncharacterized protein n=1 Tax=Moniliophthora roreri TaxID=221103 RepID=A0A0W0G1B9_MONRR
MEKEGEVALQFELTETSEVVLTGYKLPSTGKQFHPKELAKAYVTASYMGDGNEDRNPLEGMPKLPANPPKYTLGVHYTEEQKKVIDENHPEGFLLPEERKLLHCLLKLQEMAFAWEESEAGIFREDFFP